MSEREARARAVYDHADEEPRRRRQVADWGVGEELFDGMPGRHFERRGDDHAIPRGQDHAIPRGGAGDGRRTIVISEGETAEPNGAAQEFMSRDDALGARRRHEEAWAAGEPAAHSTPEVVRGGVEGRRTVRIGGRPAEFYTGPTRRRPSQTVHDRFGSRPDRIAAWAFALGLLLILIALATASI
jgi:hypothetical protein